MLRRDLLKVMAAAGMAPAVLAQDGAVIVNRIALLDGRVVMPVTIGGRGTEVVLPLARAGTPQPVRFTLQPFL